MVVSLGWDIIVGFQQVFDGLLATFQNGLVFRGGSAVKHEAVGDRCADLKQVPVACVRHLHGQGDIWIQFFEFSAIIFHDCRQKRSDLLTNAERRRKWTAVFY